MPGFQSSRRLLNVASATCGACFGSAPGTDRPELAAQHQNHDKNPGRMRNPLSGAALPGAGYDAAGKQ